MLEEVNSLMEAYSSWLKENSLISRINSDWCKITTPFLDRHNDCLQLYIKKENSSFILTDDGYIINDLTDSGCPLDSKKRKDLLKMIIAGFGIELSDHNELFCKASGENFSMKKHNLIQAMLAVNDLFYLAKPMVSSLFYEDVSLWLDESDIRYTPKIKFSGKSGYDHLFNFVIPKSRNNPERIIETINNPGKDSIESVVFKWLDTKEVRPGDSLLYIFLNDTSKFNHSIIDALHNYQLHPVVWSEREKYKNELVA